jgi:hypothetical protein
MTENVKNVNSLAHVKYLAYLCNVIKKQVEPQNNKVMITTHRTKADYINNLKNRIAMREALLKAYNEVYPAILKEFNGKVLNKRFWDTLQERLQAINQNLWVKKEIGIKNCFEIHMRRNRFDYGDYENVRCMLIVGEDKRINADAGQTEQAQILTAFAKGTDKYHDAINHYDQYMAVANALEAACKAYNALPYTFTENIPKCYLYIK